MPNTETVIADQEFLDFFETTQNELAPTKLKVNYKQLSEEDEYAKLIISKNRYTKKLLINEGGFKKIYCAYDEFLTRYVALAEMSTELNYENFSLFMDEVKILASTNSTGVITIHDIALNAEGLPFYTMPLLDGWDLKEIIFDEVPSLLANRTYNLSDQIEILILACDSVIDLHQQSIIHLDLTPSNIKITSQMQVFICDFGNAQRLSKDVMWDNRFSYRGTNGFTAPECKSSIDIPVNTQADIYSLGGILYTIIRKAYPPDTDLLNHINSIGAELPECYLRILNKCFQDEPQNRYLTVNEFQKALQEALQQISIREVVK